MGSPYLSHTHTFFFAESCRVQFLQFVTFLKSHPSTDLIVTSNREIKDGDFEEQRGVYEAHSDHKSLENKTWKLPGIG